MQKIISAGIEQNQHDFLESIISLNDVVKKDGRMCLEPKSKGPDSFITKLKCMKPFNFCVKLAELHKASIAIKLDLRSTEEVNMQIKHASVLHKD